MSARRDALRSHNYAEAIDLSQRALAVDPDDLAPIETLAPALRAVKRDDEALQLYRRLDVRDRADRIANGRPGRRKDISCLLWVKGDRLEAMRLMHELATGILDGSIEFGDLAGGVEQGLLLYYMGVTAGAPQEVSYALKYLQNRAKRSAAKMFPGHVAKYYLDEISFEDVLEGATKQRDLTKAIAVAQTDLLARRQLCVSLFHDGAKARAREDEAMCLTRMRQCFALEDTLIEVEWYLARFESEQAM